MLVLVLSLLFSVVVRAEDTLVAQDGEGVPLGSELFDDVPAGHWADEEIGWAATTGVMEGVGGGRFDLAGVVPRWQMARSLYRASVLAGGSGAVEGLGSSVFFDVPAGHVADREIGWAAARGITVGVGGGQFDPNGSVTRAQIVTFLLRLSGFVGGPVGGESLGSDSFSDVPVGHWADEEVGWAVANGITVGVGQGRFALNRVVSRAQIVTFLFRVHRLLVENTVPVRVEGVDLPHVEQELRVSIGLQDPVGVGGTLVGRAMSTGLAVAVDTGGTLQGLGLALKADEPGAVTVDYETTAAALVFMTPGLVSTNPLTTLAVLWKLWNLEEFRALADQLEKEAGLRGGRYLTDFSPETTKAIQGAVVALIQSFTSSRTAASSSVPRSYGYSLQGEDIVVDEWRGLGLGGTDVGTGCGGIDCMYLAFRQDPCTGRQTEVSWDALSSKVGRWYPIENVQEQNDGVCIVGSSEGMTVTNHSWSAVAAPVQVTDDGRLGFRDSYVLLSSEFVKLPDTGDFVSTFFSGVTCGVGTLFGWRTGYDNKDKFLNRWIGKACVNFEGWRELFDVRRGGITPLTGEDLANESENVSEFAVIKSSLAGDDPYDSFRDSFVVSEFARHERTANIYQGIHMAIPLVTLISEHAAEHVLTKAKGWVRKLEGKDVARLEQIRTRFSNTLDKLERTGEITVDTRDALAKYYDVSNSELQLAQWLTVLIDGLLTGNIHTLPEDLNFFPDGHFSWEVAAGWVLTLAEIALVAVGENAVEKALPVVRELNAVVGLTEAAANLALQGTQWGYERVAFYALGEKDGSSPESDQGGPDFLLVLDASGSMTENVAEGRKIDIAVNAVSQTYEAVRRELGQRAEVMVYQARSGFFGFGCSVPSISAAAEQWTKSWEPVPVVEAGGATPTGRALQAAMYRLGYVDEHGNTTGGGSGEIVLISDGLSNCPPPPCGVVTDSNTPVIVHTVGFLLAGDRTSAEEELRCISQATGGRHEVVEDAAETVQTLLPIVREQEVVHHVRNVPDGFNEKYSWWWFTDRDGDGIPDRWEEEGIYRSTWRQQVVDGDPPQLHLVIDGQESLDLQAAGAHPDRKDLFVYYDWEEGARLDQEVFDLVEAAFADAPFDNGQGINLHFVPGQEIPTGELPEATHLAGLGAMFKAATDYTNFDESFWAGYSRRAGLPQIAKYILIRPPCEEQGCPFGQALSIPGNYGVLFMGGDTWCESVVNLLGDCWLDNANASVSVYSAKVHVQAATLMHVLGHLLGLRHHGAENCPSDDPAYSSVMSHAYTAVGIEQEHGEFLLDFSRDSAINLDWKQGIFNAQVVGDSSCTGRDTKRSTNDGAITFVLNQYREDPDFYVRYPVNLSPIKVEVELQFGQLNATNEPTLAAVLQQTPEETLTAFAEYFRLDDVPEGLRPSLPN